MGFFVFDLLVVVWWFFRALSQSRGRLDGEIDSAALQCTIESGFSFDKLEFGL